jgi:hypothetical protein
LARARPGWWWSQAKIAALDEEGFTLREIAAEMEHFCGGGVPDPQGPPTEHRARHRAVTGDCRVVKGRGLPRLQPGSCQAAETPGLHDVLGRFYFLPLQSHPLASSALRMPVL